MLSQYLMIDSKNAHGNYSMMTCGKILPKDYQVIIVCLSFFNLSLFVNVHVYNTNVHILI